MSGVRIPDELKTLCKPLAWIKPNPANANRHPASQIDALVASFTEFGVDQPVITNAKGVLIAGHGRLEAARQLGMTEYPVVINDLSSLDATRRMIGDNRLSQLAEPDTEALGELLRQLQAEDALQGTGYDDGAVDALLAELAKGLPKEPGEDKGPQIDKAAELQARYGVSVGQTWILGNHRIVCGDCTDVAVVRGLMQGDKVDCVITDPPYGVDYDGGTKVREKLSGDKEPSLYLPFLSVAREFAANHLAVYLFYADGDAAVTSAVTSAGYEVRNTLIWNKNLAQFGALSAQYKQKHEPFLYCHIKGKSPQWFGPTNEVTVWDINRATVNDLHPTQKPVELFERAIRNSTKKGDCVMDGFSGSGTTLAACERLDRRARCIELNPSYVAVSIQRLADMGLTPRLLT